MANPANGGHLIGRLTRDVKIFANQDGSQKRIITLAVDDNFRSGPDNKAQTNIIQVETFVQAAQVATTSWNLIHEGDLVAIDFRVDGKPYEKNGETIYPTKLVAEGFPTFLEPKSVTDKRAAEKAVKRAQNGAAPADEQSAEDRIAALEAELAAARQPAPAAGN